jgi:hypothetical protein
MCLNLGKELLYKQEEQYLFRKLEVKGSGGEVGDISPLKRSTNVFRRRR